MNHGRKGSGFAVTSALESGGRNTRRYTPTRQMEPKYSERLSANSAGRKSRWFPPGTTGHSSAAASTNGSTGNTTISAIMRPSMDERRRA